MLILITILLLYSYFINFAHPKLEVRQYSDLKHKFKTGDIILFHGLDNINSLILGYYSHIGLVYVDDNTKQKYLFEAFNPKRMPYFNNFVRSGIAMTPLKERLTTFRGYCFYKELVDPIKKKSDINNLNTFINYAKRNMFYNPNVLSCGIKRILCNTPLTNATNCAELIYICLIKLGLLSQNKIKKNNFHHLYYLSNLTKTDNGNEYKHPQFILSNYFENAQ